MPSEARAEDKPAWVPQRAWDDYQLVAQANLELAQIFDLIEDEAQREAAFQAITPGYELMFDESQACKVPHWYRGGFDYGWRVKHILKRVIYDEGCKRIWPVVYSAKAAVSQGHVALADALIHALAGPRPTHLVSASARKARGDRIAKLARQLRGELDFFTEIDDIPHELWRPLFETVHAELVAEHPGISVPTAAKTPAQERADKDIASVIVQYLVFGKISLLQALEAGAIEWRQTKPIEYRPDGTLEQRNHFVRAMTNFFRHHAGSPYRNQVVALTRCFLGLDLDTSDVRTIAP